MLFSFILKVQRLVEHGISSVRYCQARHGGDSYRPCAHFKQQHNRHLCFHRMLLKTLAIFLSTLGLNMVVDHRLGVLYLLWVTMNQRSSSATSTGSIRLSCYVHKISIYPNAIQLDSIHSDTSAQTNTNVLVTQSCVPTEISLL